VLVRAAWDGIKVIAVPVSVYYPPQGERITHFRPFKDFTRISILNTVLVLITFLYIKPRDFLKGLFEKKKWPEFFNEQLINPAESNWIKACSVAFGIFMGIIPIWGFQLIIAIALSFVLKLNKILVVVAANISLPPMIPLIIFLSYKIGAFWMGPAAGELSFDGSITLASIQKNLQQYIYGSVTLAILAGVFAGLFTLLLLKLFNRKSILTG